MSLSLALRPAHAIDPGVVSTSGGSSLTVLDGTTATGGYFLQSGTYNISDVTLQNFSTVGGDGSGGGGGFGGALFINTGAQVTLNNVNFLSNNARGGNGGARDVNDKPITIGGSLNNLFASGTSAASGAVGFQPNYNLIADINGANGTKGGNGANSTTGFGGAGGDGADGTGGGDSSPLLIAAAVHAGLSLAKSIAELPIDSSNPFTINVGLGDALGIALDAAGLAIALTDVIAFDKALADGHIGVGGAGGSGGQAGKSAFGYGGSAGGDGGNGGAGGQPWGGSFYANTGGAAGGDAGSGGLGGMGGFGAGGGAGGDGGLGGAGASWSGGTIAGKSETTTTTVEIKAYYEKIERFAGQDDNGNPVQNTDPMAANYSTNPDFYKDRTINGTYHPAQTKETTNTVVSPGFSEGTGKRPDGLDGSGGAGGSGGFGGGVGATGTGYSTLAGGGAGGNGYGGAIFVRAGATLTITGNAIFDGNGVRGGDGQAADATHIAGASGIGAGSNLFMMKGSTVILDPGAGNVITFNSDAYGTGIADDSASSIIPSGGFAPIRSGEGAGITIKSGLVQFNGGNLYSGQTKIEGGTLQANDGDGIYWDSNINLAGTTTSNAVLMGNGDMTRFLGAQSNRLQWTGSGGFAANGGELNVRLSGGQTLNWGSTVGFVKDGDALIFGSETANDKVNFSNNINLGIADRTILVTANAADEDAGIEANIDHAVFSGVLSGSGGLNLGDANHTGIVVLAGKNTYSGATNVNGGGLALAGDGSLNTGSAVTLADGASFDISGINGSSRTIASLTAATNNTGKTAVILGAKNLTTGGGTSTTVAAVISGDGGSLTKQGSAVMTLSGANTYTGATLVKAGTLATSGNERLADATNVTVESGATFRIGGTEAVGTIEGAGAFNLQGNTLTTNADADTTVSGIISGSGGSLVKNGTAKLTLTGANDYSGATTINDGTVALSGGGSLSDSTALSITAATGVFDISAKTGASETIASINTAEGSSVVLGAKNLTAGNTNDTTVAGTISGTGGSFTKTGSGKTTFTAANTYTGATTITDGTVALSAGGSLSDSTAVNITSATGTFDISAIDASSETIASIAGVADSKVILGAKNLTAGDSTDTTMAGVISGTDGSLTKQGSGKLTLSGANTYTGDTTVNVGTVETSGNERIANASDIIVASGAIFRLGGNESVSSIAGAGNIELQANTLITNNALNVNTTFSGIIKGDDNSVLTKTGTGKLTLSGANESTGTANFNGGSADLTGSLASKIVNVASGVVLDSKTAGLASAADVGNNGTINLGSTDDTVKSYTSTGTLNGPGTLTALNYNLNGGSIINANLGTGTIITNGNVDLFGTSGASSITINALSVLNLKAGELILNTATVDVKKDGTLNLAYGPDYSSPYNLPGTETFQKLMGGGTINTNGNALIVADGGSFTGILNASGASLNVGGGSSGTGGGGSLNLGGGTTTTDSTTIQSGLTIGSGATLNSTTITIANGSILDLSGGGTIIFTTLTTPKGDAPAIINIGANDFTIPFGSTISGNITFIGTGKVFMNGTLSSGHSPGITAVPAAFVDGPASTTNLELAGLGGVAGTDFDQLRLATTLAANGTLNVAPFGGFTSAQGNSFQVFSNAGGAALTSIAISGAFTTVTFDNDGFTGPPPLPVSGGGPNPSTAPTAAFVLDLDTGVLTTTGLNNPTNTYADLGSNANQRAAAASIFAAATAGVGTGPSQIRTSTTEGLLAQQITDAANGSAADLAKYVPDYYGSLSDYAFMGNQVLVQSIQDRVSALNYIPAQISEDRISEVPETMSVYFGYSYANMNTADKATASRNDYYAGVNMLASEEYVVGLAGSMSEGNIKAPLGNASSDGFGGMIYGRYTVAKSWTFFGSFGINQQNFDLTRQTVNGTVTGSTDATSYVGFLGVQYKGWRVGGVSIAPRLSFTYSDTQVGGFSESGAIDALNVGGYSNTRFMAEAGISALWSTELAGRAFNVEGAISVQQALQNSKSAMTVNVAAVPTASYGVNFANNGDTQAVARLNASLAISKAVTGYVGYEGQFGNQTAQYAKAGFRINF